MTDVSAASPTGSAPAAPAAAAPAAAAPAVTTAAPAAVAPAASASPAATAEGTAPAAPAAATTTAPAAPAAPANETPEAKTAREASEKTAREASEKATADARAASRSEYGKEIADNVKKAQDAWNAAAKIDPEYGGEKFEENKGIARGAIAAYCTPEFIEFIDKAGLGNHPEMLRAFFRIGKDIAQDKLVVGRQANGGSEKSPANMLWPNLK